MGDGYGRSEEEWGEDEHDQNILYACLKFAKINEMLHFINVINLVKN